MTARDRTMVMGILVAVAMAAFWFLLLSPKRQDANALSGQIKTSRVQLQAAQDSITAGLAAERGYASDYATVARLGKAVPVQDDVPSLVYQLQSAAHSSSLHFDSIALAASSSAAAPAVAATPSAQVAAVGSEEKGGNGSAAAAVPATQTAAAVLPPGASVGAAGFPTMPFDFAFTGSFFHLDDFLSKLNKFTSASGNVLHVGGRLLTVDGIEMSHGGTNIHATAYLLPDDQGLLAGATPAGPAATASAATPVSSSTSTKTAPPVAVVSGVGP